MKLKSRYGDTWELTEIEGGYRWTNVPDYTRYGYYNDNHPDFCFVDPPGGPFLEVGREIQDGELIISITKDGNDVILHTHQKES